MSKANLAIVILAAGQGSRMKSDLPKVIHPLAGAPMITHLLRTAEGLAPKKIIVVLSPDMTEVERIVSPHSVALQKQANGTAGALKAAMGHLKDFRGDVLILLGDAPLITLKTLKNLIKTKMDGANVGISVLGVTLENPSGYGRLVMEKSGILNKIVEEKDSSISEKKIKTINAGAFCLDGAKLESWLRKVRSTNAQGEYYITDLPEIAAKEGVITKVALTKDSDEVKGCNSRVDLAALEMIAQNRLRAAAMLKGVTMVDPSTVYLSYDTKIARDVVIEPHVVFGVGVEVASGTYIKAFSYLEGTKVGKDVAIGPFARLRPGADIGEGARIGNFVEIKKSKIGKRSKIGHLAYVGDCLMGEDVNFSAGAITVNYDGFEKHQTLIGKGVMIGSNVNLVAPLCVDDGAFIAAGSTITDDVPADALSIARDAHKIREGWAVEYRKKKKAIMKKLARKKKGN